MMAFLKRRLVWMAAVTALFVVLVWPLQMAAQVPSARRVSPAIVAAEVYAQLPDLPLENQYISDQTSAPAIENTLVSRFIRYHLYIRQRRVNLRFQWKLTMAEYLGAFERMSPQQYVDYGLRTNPYEGDRTAIAQMSRESRDQLVNAIYESFTQAESAQTEAVAPHVTVSQEPPEERPQDSMQSQVRRESDRAIAL